MSVAAEKAGEYAVAIRAEELIGKHFRMFPNQNEHSGPEGKPIETIDLSKYTAEEIETLERISERVNSSERERKQRPN